MVEAQPSRGGALALAVRALAALVVAAAVAAAALGWILLGRDGREAERTATLARDAAALALASAESSVALAQDASGLVDSLAAGVDGLAAAVGAAGDAIGGAADAVQGEVAGAVETLAGAIERLTGQTGRLDALLEALALLPGIDATGLDLAGELARLDETLRPLPARLRGIASSIREGEAAVAAVGLAIGTLQGTVERLGDDLAAAEEALRDAPALVERTRASLAAAGEPSSRVGLWRLVLLLGCGALVLLAVAVERVADRAGRAPLPPPGPAAG
ncbi:MAG: hypothetical protein R3C15_16400 [Thermoleophilia bacterium]